MITVALILVSIVLIIVLTTKLNIHPFIALIIASFFFGICSGVGFEELILTINEGFGDTVGKVGIIIIAGIIIGAFLEHSGGAYALAYNVLKLVGKKRVHTAMGLIGYVVSIPVFGDSGFIILAPLNRALSKEAKVSLAGTAVALYLGLMATHTMVPPTPGPITAAGLLDADLGLVIFIGLFASIGAAAICMVYAKYYVGKKCYIDPQPDLTQEEVQQKIKSAPASWKSLLPILIPIILIVLRSFANYPTQPFGEGVVVEWIRFLGNPVMALIIGVLLALLLPKKLEKKMFGTDGWIGNALKFGAVIILITGAGGAFGKVLQTSDIEQVLGNLARDYPIGLWLPFIVAACIKTAQGSSTVAITTTASIMAPLMLALGMETEIDKAMMVVAIGAGSAVVAHANDSGFWVVTQLSDMNVGQGYKYATLGTAILGFSAMLLLTILNFII